jgi:hypothetical protein
MKRRVWKILAVDLAAGAVFGGAVLSGRGASPTVVAPSPAPSWGLFSPAQWQTVSGRLARRGFEPASIRVVGGMLTFADDVTDAVSLRAYRADGRVLARIDLGA